MDFYNERMKAYRLIDDMVKKSLSDGISLSRSTIVLQVSSQRPIAPLAINKRLDMWEKAEGIKFKE